jgi:hypothetical protein
MRSTTVDDRGANLAREPSTTQSDGPEGEPMTRADRLAAAHAWVLQHHAETFAKLAK